MPSAPEGVPSVYGCYLLRSLSSPNRSYVGSTNNPRRRIRQHNGEIPQGAFRTRLSRPWVMDAFVFGFPSRIAALQFEWSWQNPVITRFLRMPLGDGDAHGAQRGPPLFTPTRKATGRRRVGRISSAPEARFHVLRALLHSEPFCFWDLRVALFTEYAYGVWRFLDARWEEKHGTSRWHAGRVTGRGLPNPPKIVCEFTGVDGNRAPVARTGAYPSLPEAASCSDHQKKLQKGNKRTLERDESDNPEPTPPARSAEALGLAWRDIDAAPRPEAADAPVFAQLDKQAVAVERMLVMRQAAKKHRSVSSACQEIAQQEASCAICKDPIVMHDASSYTFCPGARLEGGAIDACRDLFHVECLGKQYTQHSRFCLPIDGACPSCHARHSWSDVVRRISRRCDMYQE